VGRGVTTEPGYGREALRVMASVRYEREFLDADGDGVEDRQDRCPTQKEDRDGFKDSDGCLDEDNDGDGIRDGEDACPDQPGPKEYDGCPDRDGDEIPDNVDKCPDQPGPVDNEGCPYDEPPSVTIEANRIRIKGDIRYETGSARIQKQSFPLLNEVATVLLKNPDLGPVVVEGHTDNRGSRPFNLDLSERRARSVVDYLVGRGVKADRLRSRGYGFDRPISDNATALGRARNRRVEFRLENPADESAAPDAPSKGGTPKK
jgi:OOP family OmpA-OmpF porin